MGNRSAKNMLIQMYGKECFIDKLGLRKDKNRHYTSVRQMQKMKKLTYHHIVEKSKGGEATVENGALLSVENHVWFNKQSPAAQARMNKLFQEYKACNVVFVETVEVSFKLRFFEFSVSKRVYNRSKVKRETRRLIEEDLLFEDFTENPSDNEPEL